MRVTPVYAGRHPALRLPAGTAAGIGFFAAGIGLACAQVPADAYPAKPIRMINSLSAGASADNMNRVLAEGLSQRLNQRIVVENKPGDSGNIAAMATVKAVPDGYTLFMSSTASLAIQMTYAAGRLEYDIRKDLAPISSVAQIPNGLFVSPALATDSLPALVAYAKANPGKLICASAGVGGLLHLTCELFKKSAGIDLLHVPYKGTTAIRPDLMEGRVGLLFDNVPVYVPLVNAGKLRALAVTSPQRAVSLPSVPTTAELGMPGIISMGLFSLYAPPRTGETIIARLNRELVATLRDRSLRDKLILQGVEPAGGTPQELRAQVEAEVERWAAVIRETKIVKE
jgi:tripartite-type tricarboxylate transporter receptor subunit TctC